MYSFGGNTCGQLGQFNPSPFSPQYEGGGGSNDGGGSSQRKRTSLEDFQIIFPKPHMMQSSSFGRAPSVSDSFIAANEYDSPRGGANGEHPEDEGMNPAIG